MEPIDQLESHVDQLIAKIKELEEENARLSGELEQARSGRDEIRTRVDRLLERIGQEIG